MINKGIDKYFNDPNIKIISEPGRYFCDAAFTLITKVISIRETFDGIRFYYLNDGVYKNFSAIYFEGKQYANPKFLKVKNNLIKKLFFFSQLFDDKKKIDKMSQNRIRRIHSINHFHVTY